MVIIGASIPRCRNFLCWASLLDWFSRLSRPEQWDLLPGSMPYYTVAQTMNGFSNSKVHSDTKPGEMSDGYHTFDELYEHRNWLFLCLAAEYRWISWFSQLHEDGTSLDGWFIAGIEFTRGPITYHIPNRMLPAFRKAKNKGT